MTRWTKKSVEEAFREAGIKDLAVGRVSSRFVDLEAYDTPVNFSDLLKLAEIFGTQNFFLQGTGSEGSEDGYSQSWGSVHITVTLSSE